QERIAGDVHAIAGSENHMVHETLRSIVQVETEPIAFDSRSNHASFRMNGYIARLRGQPLRDSRTNCALPPRGLNRTRQATEQIRRLDAEPDAGRPDVGAAVEHPADCRRVHPPPV